MASPDLYELCLSTFESHTQLHSSRSPSTQFCPKIAKTPATDEFWNRALMRFRPYAWVHCYKTHFHKIDPCSRWGRRRNQKSEVSCPGALRAKMATYEHISTKYSKFEDRSCNSRPPPPVQTPAQTPDDTQGLLNSRPGDPIFPRAPPSLAPGISEARFQARNLP